MWPFGGSTEQWTGKSGDLSVKTDIITGSSASSANTGTRINGDSVSITLATPKPENLSMTMNNGKTVRENIKSYIEQHPNTVTNHQETLQNYVDEAQQKYINDHKGKTYTDANGRVVNYATQKDTQDLYSDMTRLAGDPDLAPDTKQRLGIANVSTQSLPGVNSNTKTDFVNQTVNPYDNFYNLAGDKRRTYQQTIGGSDMSVFFLSEYPNMEDVINQVPREAQRKEIVIFELDSALSLSYSILRERFPVRTIGKVNPVTYTRGSRTIAGHIAFAVFTDDVLTRLRSQIQNKFNEISKKFDKFSQKTDVNTASADRVYSDIQDFQQQRYFFEAAFQYNKVQLLDSLPPFHLLVMGVNEQGAWSKFIIKNVCVIDENQYQGTQQPNIVNKVSWVASDIVPMASFQHKGYTVTDSLNSSNENYSNGQLSLSSSFNTMSGSNILEEVRNDLAKDIINSPIEGR